MRVGAISCGWRKGVPGEEKHRPWPGICLQEGKRGAGGSPHRRAARTHSSFQPPRVEGKRGASFLLSCIMNHSPPSGLVSSVLCPPFCIPSSAVQTQVPNAKFYLLGSWFLCCSILFPAPRSFPAPPPPAFLGSLGGPPADFAILRISLLLPAILGFSPARGMWVRLSSKWMASGDQGIPPRAWSALTSSLPTPPLTTGHTTFCATKAKLLFSLVILGDQWPRDEEF